MSRPAPPRTATVSDSGSSRVTDTSVGTAVFEAVADATDTPAEEMPVLYDVVDPDALDSLFSDSTVDGRIRFRYAGSVVTVAADGTIDVRVVADESE